MDKTSINIFFFLSFTIIYIHFIKKIILWRQDLFFYGTKKYLVKKFSENNYPLNFM